MTRTETGTGCLTDLIDRANELQALYALSRKQHRINNDLPRKRLGKRWHPEPGTLDVEEPEG